MTETLRTYWRQKRLKNLFLEQLAKTPIVSLVSEKIGVPRSTYYRWVKEDPDFWLLAQEVYTEWIKWLNDMANSQLMKLVKDWDRHAITFWLRGRDPEFWGTITRIKKPEGLAGLSKEKRDILKQLFEHREAVYRGMMEERNPIADNSSDSNNLSDSDDLSNTEETWEEIAS